MDNIKIELFQEQHYDDVIKLILDIQNDEYQLGLTIKDQPELINISDYYFKNAGAFWIAKDEQTQKIAGTIALETLSPSTSILRKMFVKQEYRKLGIAQKLLTYLLSHAKNKNVERILLDTPSVATSAHRFYEKNNFHEIDKFSIPKEYKYADRNSKIYELVLSRPLKTE